MISGALHVFFFVFCIAGLLFGWYFFSLAVSVGASMFEGSFSRGKASRKHLRRVFLAFSVLPLSCMCGGDTKRIAEYHFRMCFMTVLFFVLQVCRLVGIFLV